MPKIPKKPPAFPTPAELQDPARLRRFFSAAAHAPPPVYFHWDELIRHAPPEGLSHEDWWFGLKVQRQARRKTLPTLVDARGKPFGFVDTDLVNERLHEIDLRAGGIIQIPDPITNPETKDQYYASSLIEEAITSSQLEGAATTRQVAKQMLLEGRSPRDNSEQMILNNFLAMQEIGKVRSKPLTKDVVFDLHRQVTEGALSNPPAAGRFRQKEERIVVADEYGPVFHDPPDADELDRRLSNMCEFANGGGTSSFVHPVIRSIVLHFWLAYDHPFVDGNGRTARALFYWSMLRHGFWLFEYISISAILVKGPSKYARAFLLTETDDNDLTYFVLHQLEVIDRAIAALHAYIARKTQEVRTLEGLLHGRDDLNHRQRSILSHALRHPSERYTIEAHRKIHNVTYQTARTDLLNLRDRGLFDARKGGKKWYFVPVKGLDHALVSLAS